MYSLLLLLHHLPTRLGLVYSLAAVRIVYGARVRCTVLSTVKATLSSLENFGAQRANHVYNVVSCSPRNSRARNLEAKR